MSKIKVMIVEDEVITAKAYQLDLEELGFTCSVVFSGRKALERAATEKPDIVLMDIGLSGKMDGIEAGEQIKSRHGIPVIYITGYGDKNLKDKAGIANEDEFLLKPIEGHAIKQAIERVLRKQTGNT